MGESLGIGISFGIFKTILKQKHNKTFIKSVFNEFGFLFKQILYKNALENVLLITFGHVLLLLLLFLLLLPLLLPLIFIVIYEKKLC